MKRARHVVPDPLTFSGEPPAHYRLSEWRKVDRDPGTRLPRWACYWLRHGQRSQLAGYIWVNDPGALQVRYVAYGPLGGVIESTQHHGRAMMNGGTVRWAKARVDAILIGGFSWDPQLDRAVLLPALAATYDDGRGPLPPAPPRAPRPEAKRPPQYHGFAQWREEGLFPGRGGGPRRPGFRVFKRTMGGQVMGPWAPTLYGAHAAADFVGWERRALRIFFSPRR